jgi:hypothetical protein
MIQPAMSGRTPVIRPKDLPGSNPGRKIRTVDDRKQLPTNSQPETGK